MSWKEAEEFIDLATSRHVQVYKNADTGDVHHLIHYFQIPKCETCGAIHGPASFEDFQKKKDETLAALNAHHRQVLQYAEKHPRVRKVSK
jgi:hypothetical protein